MPNTHKTYEIRCPVYGFVLISDWEREIISHPGFQRLRRIRQLAWTDYVYPGAMHTRFEHSLGVMHMAGCLYDGIVERSSEILKGELGYNSDGLQRHRTLVRLSALLHDIGHGPFSHAAEDVFPLKTGAERYKHEHYSAAILRRHFADVIKNHPMNTNYGFTADDIANLFEGNPESGHALFWRDLITGQMDADRMDYLLRDSVHAGVDYGKYDWRRVVNTVRAVPDSGGPRIGVSEGGWHAAEGLILARYFMFTQMYFHKTRVVLDHHLKQALGEILPGGYFPKPDGADIDEYLKWDDWRVLGELSNGRGGEGGQCLCARSHYREVYHTPETPTADDLERLHERKARLGGLLVAEIPAEKSWYKVGRTDIPVASGLGEKELRPLSTYSSVIANMQPVRQVRLFVRFQDRDAAIKKLEPEKAG